MTKGKNIAKRWGLWHPAILVLNDEYAQMESFVMSIEQRFAEGEGMLIRKMRNELRELQFDGKTLVVKAFGKPNVINKFVYGIFRPSKAKRSYDNACELLSMGIATPTPVAYMNRRGLLGLTFCRSWLVTLKSECPFVYEDLFRKEIPYAEEVLRAVGRLVAKMHIRGLMHKDLSRGNILFDRKDNGSIVLELIDLNRIEHGEVDMRAGCKNFERLPATPQMHRWMAEEYARMRGFNVEECFCLMQDFRKTQPGKCEGEI